MSHRTSDKAVSRVRAEPLEPRRLLAAAIENGVLVARGSDANNTIEFRYFFSDDVVVTIWQGASTPISRQTFEFNSFNGVLLDGMGGNDRLYVNGAAAQVPGITLSGGEGNDWLYGENGGSIDESLLGGDGIDTLIGNGGRDTLVGGAGDDILRIDGGISYGDHGTLDTIVDGPGNDLILATGVTSDFFSATGNSVSITGSAGADRITVSATGDNTLLAWFNGSRAEYGVSGGPLHIEINAGAGNDFIGIPAFDWSRGSNSGDVITARGEGGSDHFLASQPGHALYGGDGDDVANDYSPVGGDGQPNFVSGGDGIDLLIGRGVTIDLRNRPDIENAELSGTGTVYGNALNNRLEIQGDGTIFAGDGDDTLIGSHFPGSGLHGEAGDDLIVVRDSHNTISGGGGVDTLQGSIDDDSTVSSIEAFLNADGSGGPPITPTIEVVNRILIATGTGDADHITIDRAGSDNVSVQINETTMQFDTDDFDGVLMRGLGADDYMFVKQILSAGRFNHSVTVEGGDGNDTLIGSNGEEVMRGGDGKDSIYAIGGSDEVFGGFGNDIIFGGPGTDYMDGGHDFDYFWSRDNEADTVEGGGGVYETAHADYRDELRNITSVQIRYATVTGAQ